MKTTPVKLSANVVQALRQLDACIVANAIETFHERLRNEGFTDGSVRSQFPKMGPMVGYAATIKIRGSAPPTAAGLYPDRTDLWDYILSLPTPRIAVVQDAATRVGLGSFVDTVHMNILRALGCIGAVTNGSVRDLPTAQNLGFHLFANHVALSHAYLHVVEFGKPVEIAGMKVNSGDLLHGDQHGIQTVPLDIAPQVPAAAARIKQQEQQIVALCHSSEFSLENLRAAVSKQGE